MTSLDITLDDLELDGWPFKTRKDRINHPVANSLKESNKPAYRHWKKLCTTAIWKPRWSKFKEYKDDIVAYLKRLIMYKDEKEIKETA
jgi:hypothetical protein